MVDKMVLATQKWLNDTYGNDGRYVRVSETGRTGWETIYGLTRALQIELGISQTADNFGPTTRKLYARNILTPNDRVDNMNSILQGALWCKGYDAGHFALDGKFDVLVAEGVKAMKRDAGKVNPDASVSVEFMAALLSMVQFRLIPGSKGSLQVRFFQQSMNRDYEDYCGIIPCDGLYDRNTNKAAILMLQALEGMSSDVANGVFGPSTRSLCPVLPYTGDKYNSATIKRFTYLLNVGLWVNGFGGTSVDSDYHAENISRFQRLCALPESGVADLSTWMSLFVSTGNPSRPASGCDTRHPISEERLGILKDNGITHIGRYLTHGVFKADGEDKALAEGELLRITQGGIRVVPLYQSSGNEVEYFTHDQGVSDGRKAGENAWKMGVPLGSRLYFCVDCDAMDYEVTTHVLPYFQGVRANLSGYKIGVYGARNVCSRVCDAGYADSSYVSDMSTGFSGNMGYGLPGNWAFDQIAETTISSASGDLEIDKVVVRGDVGVDSAVLPPIDATVSYDEGQSLRYSPAINVGPDDIPLHEYRKEDIVYFIQPGEQFLMAGEASPAAGSTSSTYAVLVHTESHLEKKYVTLTPSDGQQRFTWANCIQDFRHYNFSGTGLIPAAKYDVLHKKCTIFTLHYDAGALLVCGDNVFSDVPVRSGTKIAVQERYSEGGWFCVGRTHPLYMRIAAYDSGEGWKENMSVNGMTADETYIDLGMQYEDCYHTRLLW